MASISSTRQWHWETRALGLPRSLRGPMILQSKFRLVLASWPWLQMGDLCVALWILFPRLGVTVLLPIKNSSHQSCLCLLCSVFSRLTQTDLLIPLNWGPSTHFLDGAYRRAWCLWAQEELAFPCDMVSWGAARILSYLGETTAWCHLDADFTESFLKLIFCDVTHPPFLRNKFCLNLECS